MGPRHYHIIILSPLFSESKIAETDILCCMYRKTKKILNEIVIRNESEVFKVMR